MTKEVYFKQALAYLENHTKDNPINFLELMNQLNIPKEYHDDVWCLLYRDNHYVLVTKHGIGFNKIDIAINADGSIAANKIKDDFFLENGYKMDEPETTMNLADVCEMIFKRHLELGAVIWVRGTFELSIKNLYPARDKMIHEGIIFKTKSNAFTTLIAHEYENATSYNEAIEIRRELNKPTPTSVTTVTTHGTNSPALVGSGTQTTTINDTKAPAQKHWLIRGLEWIWEQIKKPLGIVFSTGIIAFLSGLKVGQSCTTQGNPTQSQSPTQQNKTRISPNENIISLDSNQRNR